MISTWMCLQAPLLTVLQWVLQWTAGTGSEVRQRLLQRCRDRDTQNHSYTHPETQTYA